MNNNHPSISEIKLYEVSDDRGNLSKSCFDSCAGIQLAEVIISETTEPYILRGLYFQKGDRSEGKFIRILSGVATWFCVDLRNNDYFGKVFALELDPDLGTSYTIPPGFAHGVLSRSGNVKLLLGATKAYDNEGGMYISFDDPMLDFQNLERPFGRSGTAKGIRVKLLSELLDIGIVPLKDSEVTP